MNREYCLFKTSKACNNCGECDRCDLNRNKTCNNCGKCLELEGFDMKAIKVDDIIEDVDEVKEYERELKVSEKVREDGDDIHSQLPTNSDLVVEDETFEENNEYNQDSECENIDDGDYMDENVEFIDDIDGLRELLEDKDKLDEMAFEVFPGVISLKK